MIDLADGRSRLKRVSALMYLQHRQTYLLLHAFSFPASSSWEKCVMPI